MEVFESFVVVVLAAEGFVVSSAMKFPVRMQTHGYEVDDIARRLAAASEAPAAGVYAAHHRGTDLQRRSGWTETTLRAASR